MLSIITEVFKWKYLSIIFYAIHNYIFIYALFKLTKVVNENLSLMLKKLRNFRAVKRVVRWYSFEYIDLKGSHLKIQIDDFMGKRNFYGATRSLDTPGNISIILFLVLFNSHNMSQYK